jgi:hypothetical protein
VKVSTQVQIVVFTCKCSIHVQFGILSCRKDRQINHSIESNCDYSIDKIEISTRKQYNTAKHNIKGKSGKVKQTKTKMMK